VAAVARAERGEVPAHMRVTPQHQYQRARGRDTKAGLAGDPAAEPVREDDHPGAQQEQQQQAAAPADAPARRHRGLRHSLL
jgi:hypothetical protein